MTTRRLATSVAVNATRAAPPRFLGSHAVPATSAAFLRPRPSPSAGLASLPIATQSWTRTGAVATPSCVPRRSMFIQTEQTPNPSSLKFVLGVPCLPEMYGTGMFFQRGDHREYQKSPLAMRLFKVEGIQGVFLGKDFITISKTEDEAWSSLKPRVFGIIMDAYAEGIEIMTEAPVVSDTTILDDDDEIVAMIKELLEQKIRPSVQEDGGDIFFVSFDEGTGVVYLQLAGSCAGCPSSSVTLKQGVENMLMHYIPEVTSVEEVDEDVAALTKMQKAFEQENKQLET